MVEFVSPPEFNALSKSANFQEHDYLRYVPFNPDFDPYALDPFQAVKAKLFDAGFAPTNESTSRTEQTEADVLVLKDFSEDEASKALQKFDPKHLLLIGGRIAELSFLKLTTQLTTLVLMDLPKIGSLAPLAKIDTLKELVIEDCSRLTDLCGLERLSRLELFRLSGNAFGGGRKTCDLSPLRKLQNLRHLSLTGLRTPDESLVLFHDLPPLETLHLDGKWPARELARVAALQPHLVQKTTFLKPLVASAIGRDMSYFDVNPDAYPQDCLSFMATGKRKPFDLRHGRDEKKINKIVNEWNDWVAQFSPSGDQS
ncbi:MAG: hypothetical protein AB3N21_17705 [Ruegeria sp.]|uniref:hypothetical protein n=1 Tax=Ruegeria sp. TaxID=1879320 RepID=UPI00349EAD25